MDLGGLTTTEAIRAVLGVSADSHELDDSVFTDFGMAAELTFNLDDWLVSNGSSLSLVQSSTNAKAISALSLCAKYLGALLLVPSLLTATSKKTGDGQDEFQRQDRDLSQLTADLKANLQHYQAILLGELSLLSTATFVLMGKAAPATDPITGV